MKNGFVLSILLVFCFEIWAEKTPKCEKHYQIFKKTYELFSQAQVDEFKLSINARNLPDEILYNPERKKVEIFNLVQEMLKHHHVFNGAISFEGIYPDPMALVQNGPILLGEGPKNTITPKWPTVVPSSWGPRDKLWAKWALKKTLEKLFIKYFNSNIYGITPGYLKQNPNSKTTYKLKASFDFFHGQDGPSNGFKGLRVKVQSWRKKNGQWSWTPAHYLIVDHIGNTLVIENENFEVPSWRSWPCEGHNSWREMFYEMMKSLPNNFDFQAYKRTRRNLFPRKDWEKYFIPIKNEDFLSSSLITPVERSIFLENLKELKKSGHPQFNESVSRRACKNHFAIVRNGQIRAFIYCLKDLSKLGQSEVGTGLHLYLLRDSRDLKTWTDRDGWNGPYIIPWSRKIKYL